MENNSYVKIIPIILSVILIGIFMPYIMSQSNPIEVEVEVPYAQPNLNISISDNQFNSYLTLNDTKSDSIVRKNYSNSSDSIALGNHLITTTNFFQEICIEQDMKLLNYSQYIWFNNGNLNLTLYNATNVNGSIIPHTYLTTLNVSGVKSVTQIYNITDLNYDLYINNTISNIYFFRFQVISGAVVLGFQNSNYTKTMKYISDSFNSILAIDYCYNITFELISNTTFNLCNANTEISNSNIELYNNDFYSILLLNFTNYYFVSNNSINITNFYLTTNNTFMSIYNIDISSIELDINNSYTIQFINDSSYINTIGLYTAYFNIIHHINIQINSVIYEIIYEKFEYIYL